MKSESIVIHCSCSDTGPALEELVRESFRVYLKRELQHQGMDRAAQKADAAGQGPGPGEDACFRR